MLLHVLIGCALFCYVFDAFCSRLFYVAHVVQCCYMFCIIPLMLLDVAVFSDDVFYLALVCAMLHYFAACYSTLLHVVFCLMLIEAVLLLHVLLDVAICLSHSFYFARCCCFGCLV